MEEQLDRTAAQGHPSAREPHPPAAALVRDGAPGEIGSLSEHADGVRARLDAAHRARETGLVASRGAIRAAANSIRAAHRQEWSSSSSLLDECRALLDQAQDALRGFPGIYHAGFLQDAEKEYAEASATLALLRSSALPGPGELRVGDPAWLNGLAEAIGECRRFLLDRLREGNVERGEELLRDMDEIHDLLASLDYPDALTGGLRRSTDVARGILERTRGEFTVSAIQAGLRDAIERETRERER